MSAPVNRGYDSDTEVSYYELASIQQQNSQSTVNRDSIGDHGYYGPSVRHSSPSLQASVNRRYVSESGRSEHEVQFTVPNCIFRDTQAVPLSCHDLCAIQSPTNIVPIKKLDMHILHQLPKLETRHCLGKRYRLLLIEEM